MTKRQTELFFPAITPFAADLSVDTARPTAHARARPPFTNIGAARAGAIAEAERIAGPQSAI